MTKYEIIVSKLERFIKKYYTNELIKGSILFFAMGFLYFLLSVGLEYFLWLGKFGRLLLFWLFVGVELLLFGRFIVYPLLKLFKISRGIGYDDAALIIGKHFTEVQDKLLNVLQLKRASAGSDSELLLASIDQKAAELHPVPFQFAVNFKSSLKYLKYAAIPVLLFLGIWISGKSDPFTDSYTRMVNYSEVYEPPAPFSFHILNENLNMKENESFELRVKTLGELIPENVQINFHGETYLLRNDGAGEFSYKFEQIEEDTRFNLEANKVRSVDYKLKVINVPGLLDFKMGLDFPAYLHKANMVLRGTGNATVPEGTKVTWDLDTKNTERIDLGWFDTILSFDRNGNKYIQTQVLKNNSTYTISTSNKDIEEYERLNYQLKVVKDQHPEIKVDMRRDTIREETLYFHGRISDDYGLTRLQLVYYPSNNEKDSKVVRLKVAPGNFDEFVYAFPDTINLPAGEPFELYFRVFDNDGFNGAKSSRSQTFDYRKLTGVEMEEKQLYDQKQNIEGMSESLEQMKESSENFEELQQLQKEKANLNYNDQKKFEEYLKRVEQESEMMKKFTEKMREDLNEFQKDGQPDEEKESLMERMQRNEEKLKEDEKLMEELKKYQDKIGKEDFSRKIEEMAQNKKNHQRNLEELLEMTKRFYVQKKAERLSEDFKRLGEEQQKLADKDSEENTSEAQKEMNEKFEDILKDLEDLEKENQKLRKPMDLGRDVSKEEDIKEDQGDATDMLEEDESESDNGEEGEENMEGEKPPMPPMSPMKQNAQKKQKSAGEKMKQMGAMMQMQMQMGDMEQMTEDAETLRQILDNLLVFSFEQEDLMDVFKDMNRDSPEFGVSLRKQFRLKENFKHVDDSLYSLALRNPMINDLITNKIYEIHINMEEGLERLAKNNFRLGTTNQQHVMTGANDLANMLSDALQNMNMMMMMMAGEGDGEGMPMPMPGGSGEGKFQLDDIIQAMEELSESRDGEEDGGEDGDQPQPGEDGDSGEEGEGNQGEDGTQEGEDGSKGKESGGDDFNEEMSARLFEIYKQQQKLRLELEDLIQREGLGVDARKLEKDMEQIEMELLRSGFSEKTRTMMIRLKERMIRYHEASYKQEQENKREATTNLKEFEGKQENLSDIIREYFNTTEILNRQSLPLQPEFKQMVQDYFKVDE